MVEFRARLALGRPAAVSKTPKDGQIYALTFSGFLPAPVSPFPPLAPSSLYPPPASFLSPVVSSTVVLPLGRASFRESVARFSLAHGVADKRAAEREQLNTIEIVPGVRIQFTRPVGLFERERSSADVRKGNPKRKNSSVYINS